MNGQVTGIEWRKEVGQSIVLIALAMVVLLAMVGLILDGGQVYFTRRNSQNTADAAAYAGARVFSVRPDNTSASTATIWNAITTYTAANYVPNANNVTAWYVDASNNNLSQINQSPFPAVDAQATGVRVYVVQQFQPTFISLLRGNSPLDVPARATVQVGPLQAPQQLMPVAIITDTNTIIPYGQLFTMEGAGTSSGNYQWVDFGLQSCNGQGGANILEQLLSIPQGCSPPPVVADDPAPNSLSWINSKPGLSPNAGITNALDDWMALPQADRLWLIPITACTGDPAYGYPAGCGQKVSGSNVYYYTWSFGEFQLIGYCWNKKCRGSSSSPPITNCPGYDVNTNFICGSFQKFNSTGSPGTPGACNTNGLNVCAMELTE
jgi:Flp pilus assembly protein TadG